MRPIRVIPWNDFPFDYVHLYQDENCFAVRLLQISNESLRMEETEDLPISTLNTSEILASQSINECLALATSKQYIYNENRYYIAAECIFDKRDPQWVRTWAPNANIIFALSTRGDKIFRCYEKGLATALSKWRTNFYAQDQRLIIPAQLFCRSPDDRVDVVCKSITARPNSILGNVDLSEATVMSPEKVNKDGISSRFLQLSYLLEAPKSVAPNEKFTVKVTALDGNGAQATEVNYDGYVVEAVDGYVPHRRCSLREGSGTFQAIALGLEDGEKMRLKFGRKYGTGLGECIVAIKS